MTRRHACPLLLGALLAFLPLTTATAAPGSPEPPPTRTHATPAEGGAMSQARREHRKVEVAELTTERRKVVANPDSGRFEAQVNANPVRVRRGNGWVDLDARLARSAGRVRPAAASVDLDLADGGAGPLVSVADGDRSVALTWAADRALPKPTLVEDKAVYTDVRPGIDLVVQTNANGFSQYLVVRTRVATADPLVRSFGFDVTAPGLRLTAVDGGLEARSADGELVFGAPRLQMWGSTGDVPTSSSVAASAYVTGSMEHGASADVGLTLRGSRLTLTPDRSLLDDPATTYPVVIDPSISRVNTNWSMVWSNGTKFWNPADDDQSARVGYDGWSGQNKKSRVFYTFDTTALAGKTVTSATFAHKQIHSPSNDCGQKSAQPAVRLDRSGTISSSTTWPGPSTYDLLDTSTTTAGSIEVCNNPTRQEWDATAGAKDAAKNSWDTLTVRLSSADESDKWGWRQYQNTSSYPVLSITYDTSPVTPGAVTIAGMKSYGGANFVGSTRPQLTVTVKDPDAGDSVKAIFIVNPDDPADSLDDRVFIPSDPVSSPGTTGKPVSLVPDAGIMTEGNSYSIYARADDGTIQTPSGDTTHVVIDTTAPGAPAASGPTTTVSQGSSVTFHVDAPEGDVAGYLYGLNTTMPSTSVNAASLGAAVDISVVARQFGPNFFTVQSVDRAGNRTASPVRLEFKVAGTLPSNRYRLDRNGTDTRTNVALGSSPSSLTVPTSPAPTWVPGRDATFDGTTTSRDCTDSAIQLSPSTALKSLTTPTNHPLDTSQSFTASAWLRTDDLSTTSSALGERTAVAMNASSGTAPFMLGYRRDSVTGTVYWMASLANPSARLRVESSTPANAAVTAGRWTHVASVYDAAAGTASFYVDSRLVASTTTSLRPARGAQLSLGAGAYGTGSQLTWNGAVDEVLLYQGALDATQVREQFVLRRPTTAC